MATELVSKVKGLPCPWLITKFHISKTIDVLKIIFKSCLNVRYGAQ